MPADRNDSDRACWSDPAVTRRIAGQDHVCRTTIAADGVAIITLP